MTPRNFLSSIPNEHLLGTEVIPPGLFVDRMEIWLTLPQIKSLPEIDIRALMRMKVDNTSELADYVDRVIEQGFFCFIFKDFRISGSLSDRISEISDIRSSDIRNFGYPVLNTPNE